MTNETKFLLKKSSGYNILIGICVLIVLTLFKKGDIGLVYFLGLIVATINFCIASIKVDKHLNNSSKPRKGFISSYIFRISLIGVVSIVFSNNSYYLISYVLGFISHYPILIISYLKNREEVS